MEIQKGEYIVKSNKLINGKEQKSLSGLEQKIILQCIAETSETSFTNPKSIRIQDVFGSEKISSYQYNAFRKACKTLISTAIAFEEFENGEWSYGKYNTIFTEIEAIKKTGIAKFQFNALVKNHIIGLKSNFTVYEHKHIKGLDSGFSIRIYELLMQGKNKYRSREFAVEGFINILSLENVKSYREFKNIRSRILDKACQEITEKTDINVHWEVSQKQGRKITHICFTWDFKEGVPLEVRMLHHNLKTSDNENDTQIEKLVKPQRDKKSEAKTTTEPISETPISTTNTEAATISPFVEEPIKESTEERVQRLMQRLQSYGIDMFTAMRVCANTQASADSGIWKVLYDLKMAVNDQKISNPKAYLEKILKEQFY